MLISTVCPRCRDTYHLQEELRGKPYRCRNCRHVFLIDDQPPTAEQTSGSVGDIIPLLASEDEAPPMRATHVSDVLELLPAERVEPDVPLEKIQPDEPPAADWSSPPPVRRPQPPAETPKPKPRTKRVEAEPPAPEARDWTAPPPVRRADDTKLPEPKNENAAPPPAAREKPDKPPETHSDHDFDVQPKTKWVKWLIIPLVCVAVAGLGGGAYLIWTVTRQTEEKLAAIAAEFFDNGQFGPAAENYDKLVKKYPDSEDNPYYRFRYDLADLRRRLADGDNDLGDTLDHAGQFLKERQKDPLLEKDAAGLGEGLIKRLTDFAQAEQNDPKGDESLAVEEKFRKVVEAAIKKVKLPKDADKPDWGKLDKAFADLRQAVDRFNKKKDAVAKLHDLAKTKTGYAAVVAIEDYLREIRPSFPDVADSDEARKVLEQAFDNHLAGVRYQTAKTDEGGPSRAGGGQLDEPSILFDPELKSPGLVRPGNPEEVPALALVRGVLYAMDRTTGRVLWARRVGIDTTALPVVVPRRVALKDLLLVLSSDTNTLTALNVRGGVEWSYALPAPVLGRPVVAESKAYLATYTGEVHEIELIEGTRLGTYNLGQRLTLGGAAEPGSSRVYFAADDGCVYVLDVAKQRCEHIVYSRHPAGSLRGEPILLPPVRDEAPGYLVLNQAAGLDSVRLRVFDLPIRDRGAAERPLKHPATLDGWTWFAPYHDPEKLILLSDAGKLGLFGIKQPNNRDQALFSLLPGGSYDLAARLGGAKRRGRGEVVQVEGEDVWVLASGLMQRLRLAWGQQQGPRLIDVWPKPLDVGSPVHASQSFGSRLVTVTQPTGRSCTWVSGVDDEAGALLWQRQLGLVARAEPVPIPMPAGGEPIWLTLDQAGGLFALDPTRYVPQKTSRWLSDKHPVLIAEGLQENLDQPPVVLPAPDGQSAYVLAFPGDGSEMVVRQVTAARNERALEKREGRVALHDKLSGRPAIVGSHLLLPLADGIVWRVPLPLPAEPVPESGPTWRAERIGAEARCVVVPTGGTRFVTNNGARGLSAWDWPAGAPWAALPAGRGDEPTLPLKERVVNAAALPGLPLIAVSDSAGGVTLVEHDAKGALTVKREWRLGGEVTAGPFVRGNAIGCVVNRTTLVWLDPAAPQEAWRHTPKSEAPIVGEPRLCDGLLVVADQSGRYVALNPATGKPVGDGYALRGSVAPVASPVTFQKGRLLAPLSDGTVLLLGAARLR